MNHKDIIPKQYWSGNRKPKALTVQDLIDHLADLPKDLEIKVGFGDGCQLTVYNINTDSMRLSIDEVD